jgi:TPR repeat protein
MAQRYLGELYLEGHIVKKDVWSAVGYLQSAADQGERSPYGPCEFSPSSRTYARDAYADDDGDDKITTNELSKHPLEIC